MLEHSAKYGLQIASFFPAVCQLPQWSIAAEVMWKEHYRKLKLDESGGLVSHYANFTAYQPEEIRMFSDYFRTTQTGWTLDDKGGADELYVEDKSTDSLTGKYHMHFCSMAKGLREDMIFPSS